MSGVARQDNQEKERERDRFAARPESRSLSPRQRSSRTAAPPPHSRSLSYVTASRIA